MLGAPHQARLKAVVFRHPELSQEVTNRIVCGWLLDWLLERLSNITRILIVRILVGVLFDHPIDEVHGVGLARAEAHFGEVDCAEVRLFGWEAGAAWWDVLVHGAVFGGQYQLAHFTEARVVLLGILLALQVQVRVGAQIIATEVEVLLGLHWDQSTVACDALLPC